MRIYKKQRSSRESKREALSAENSLRDLRHGALTGADIGGHVDGDAVGLTDGCAIEEASDERAREGISGTDRAFAETFDRDMPIHFLPIKFDKLRLKLEAAARCGYDKAITFEFSHFMSPQSAYLQAGCMTGIGSFLVCKISG